MDKLSSPMDARAATVAAKQLPGNQGVPPPHLGRARALLFRHLRGVRPPTMAGGSSLVGHLSRRGIWRVRWVGGPVRSTDVGASGLPTGMPRRANLEAVRPATAADRCHRRVRRLADSDAGNGIGSRRSLPSMSWWPYAAVTSCVIVVVLPQLSVTIRVTV